MLFGGLPDIFVGTFGQPVTVTPNGGSLRTITAIVRRRTEADLLDAGAATSDHYISARLVDVSDVEYGDPIVIDGVTYAAGMTTEDAEGMAQITLRAV